MREDERKANKRDIIAAGASAGGLHALSAVLCGLPGNLAATILVVQHLDPRYQSHMPDILSRRCILPVVEATDGAQIRHSMIYFAPPDRHMLVEQDRIRLTTTELVHFVRPSVDLLFESVAAAYGPRVIGVILTGSGSDGALGIRAIKETGGVTIAQDPLTADSTGMPSAAIATGAVDVVLPLEDIGKRLLEDVGLEEKHD